MEKRKCISCSSEFEEKKELKKLKVTLNNPGEIFFEGSVITCPHCKEDYADSQDMLLLAEQFEREYNEKNFKKLAQTC